MSTCLQNGLLTLGLLVAMAGTAAAGVEKPVELDMVPATVMDVAKANLANLKLAGANTLSVDEHSVVDDDNIVVSYAPLGEVTMVSANTETEEDGSVVYEIQGTFKDGRKVEIDIAPNGTVEEIEIEFQVADVPGAVLKAINEKLPEFKPEFIEASHSRSMQVIGYEFVGKMGETTMDIEVSADGRRVVVADQ